jgi:hypothetical protein
MPDGAVMGVTGGISPLTWMLAIIGLAIVVGVVYYIWKIKQV